MTYEANRFSAARVKPSFFEGARQDDALSKVSEVISIKGDQGQALDALHLNREFSGNTAIVWLASMLEDINSLDLRYTAYQLAAKNPENPVLLVGVPGHGSSDPLTDAQRRETRDSGELTLVAASQAVAVRDRLSDVSDMVVGGHSTGGRLAFDFATVSGELGLRPKALLGFNVVGLDARPSIATAVTFLVDGYFNQRKYHIGADNERLDYALRKTFKEQMSRVGFQDKHNDIVNDYRIFRRDPSYLGFLFLNSPLANDHGFHSLETALDVNPEMQAALVSGGLDKVTRWRKIQKRVSELVSKYPERLSWDVWPGDGHSMGIGSQQPRFAECVRAVLDDNS